MATELICDNCGAPAIGKVEVAIIADNLLVAGQPTGTSAAQDLCAACRPIVLPQLFAAALAQIGG